MATSWTKPCQQRRTLWAEANERTWIMAELQHNRLVLNLNLLPSTRIFLHGAWSWVPVVLSTVCLLGARPRRRRVPLLLRFQCSRPHHVSALKRLPSFPPPAGVLPGITPALARLSTRREETWLRRWRRWRRSRPGVPRVMGGRSRTEKTAIGWRVSTWRTLEDASEEIVQVWGWARWRRRTRGRSDREECLRIRKYFLK